MMKTIKPKALKPGDLIAVTAPAGPPEPQALEQGLSFLQSLGFRIERGRTLSMRDGYLAGPDEIRVRELNRLISREDIRAIFFARGGYGSVRILDKIGYESLEAHPKILLGYSDLTMIAAAVRRKTGLVFFYGPVVTEMQQDFPEYSRETLFHLLTSGEPVQATPLPENHDLNINIVKHGKAEGVLEGGCLTLVQNLIGTDFLPDMQDKILFLEEIKEDPYRIDRMLMHLKNAGIFNRVAGVVIGYMKDCIPKDSEPSLSLKRIYTDVFKDFHGPVLAGLPFGHDKPALTLPMGTNVVLTGEPPYLFFTEAAVD